RGHALDDGAATPVSQENEVTRSPCAVGETRRLDLADRHDRAGGAIDGKVDAIQLVSSEKRQRIAIGGPEERRGTFSSFQRPRFEFLEGTNPYSAIATTGDRSRIGGGDKRQP